VGSVALACASLLAVSGASAANVGPYVFGNVGLGVGSTKPANNIGQFIQAGQAEGATISQKDKKNSFTGELGAGYRFSPNLAGELSYQYLGQYGKSYGIKGSGEYRGVPVNVSASPDNKVSMQGLRLAVLGIYPVSSRFEVFGSLSAHVIHYSSKTTLNSNVSVPAVGRNFPLDDGELKSSKTVLRPGIGAGATYKFTENPHLRGQYEFVNTKMNMPYAKGASNGPKANIGNTHLVKVGLLYQF